MFLELNSKICFLWRKHFLCKTLSDRMVSVLDNSFLSDLKKKFSQGYCMKLGHSM